MSISRSWCKTIVTTFFYIITSYNNCTNIFIWFFFLILVSQIWNEKKCQKGSLKTAWLDKNHSTASATSVPGMMQHCATPLEQQHDHHTIGRVHHYYKHLTTQATEPWMLLSNVFDDKLTIMPEVILVTVAKCH